MTYVTARMKPSIPLRAALARRSLVLAGIGALLASATQRPRAASAVTAFIPDDDLFEWTARFEREVDRRLEVPASDQEPYFSLMQLALASSKLPPAADMSTQAFVVVDCCPQVQAVFLIVRTPVGGWHWLGAAPVSTGKPGKFDHFVTPLGVVAHTLDNPDYRSEGTLNTNHIRGYGLRGRRVFDFGWQLAARGWGKGGLSKMRLQMHATDPDNLESQLGLVGSKGCIRIPAMLNVFLDQHGILDADYEQSIAAGKKLWVINENRQTIPWPGRYLVIIDSRVTERPPWSPEPRASVHSPRTNKTGTLA